MGRGTSRLAAMMVVKLPAGLMPVANASLEPDDHAFALVPGTGTPVGDVRAISIMGFTPTASALDPHEVAHAGCNIDTVGLDIEVSQAATESREGLPLPDADILSIAVSTSASMTLGHGQLQEACVCITTVGRVADTSWAEARGAVMIRVESSTEAVVVARAALLRMNPDFVSVFNGYSFDFVRMASAMAGVSDAECEFEERMLGNTGRGVAWTLPGGIMCVDPRYFLDKTERFAWTSLSLNSVATKLGLPSKMIRTMGMFSPTEDSDVSRLLEYNCHDADLHAAVAIRSGMIAKLMKLARCSSSSMWDSCANNTGVMVFCMMSAAAMAKGMMLDCGRSMGRRTFTGGFVMEPKIGLHRSVAILDGRSLYPSIMRELCIFIDNVRGDLDATSAAFMSGADSADLISTMEADTVMAVGKSAVIFDGKTYTVVAPSRTRLMTEVIDTLILRRSQAREASQRRENGAEAEQWAYKILAVSIYGSMGRANGILSSGSCAAAITCCGRAYVKRMATISERQGLRVIYGDTDFIFVAMGATLPGSLSDAAEAAAGKIMDGFKGSLFEDIVVKVDGSFDSACMVAKKCYTLMSSGKITVKGLAPARNDAPPIVRELVTMCSMAIHTAPCPDQMILMLMTIMGTFADSKAEAFPVSRLVSETAVNGKLSFVFRDKAGIMRAVAVEAAPSAREVDPLWVLERCKSSISSMLIAVGCPTPQALISSYRLAKGMAAGTR